MSFKNSLFAFGALTLISQSASAAAIQVSITSAMTFAPNRVQARVGDTVEFVNESSFAHTVTADATLALDPANVILPEGATPFHSGRILKGQTFRQVFTTPGLYQYVCLPHERMGMTGQVEVLPAEETSVPAPSTY